MKIKFKLTVAISYCQFTFGIEYCYGCAV